MEYPKVITLENDKIAKLLQEKSDLVTTGRTISEEIEKLEADMQDIDNKMKEIEKTVDVTEFSAREKEVTNTVEKAIADMNQIQSEIRAKMLSNIPKELGDTYDSLKKQKEEKETERNKVALKVQKYNDKIIPLGRKLIKPHLEDTFDDYETIGLVDGKVTATIFNHLEDFKTMFNKKKI
jgi:predicted  nucleic acid-binding Zn-ribbon protein